MQGNIFEKEKMQRTSTGLIILSNQKNILSKQQQTFNKLIKKIEKLRLELQQLNKSLNEKLEFYGKYIHPVEQQLNELNKEGAKILFRFFKNKKLLSKKERDALGAVISSKLDAVFSFEKTEPDDELKEIFKAVEGKSYEEAVEEDFDTMKNDMENMFEDMGFNMNFDDMHSKMTQEEMIRKAIEMQEQIKQQANEKEKKQTFRKKTKKQLEKEEREKQIEEARTKNIGSIYRQLAKVFHPDLERNEEMKIQKEELMKQLTIAYENNDLHTLLNLELAWIQKEENNPDNLTDGKLAIYNEVLKGQVTELEQEIFETFQHPKYAPLQKFSRFPYQIKSMNISEEKKKLESMVNEMSRDITVLKGNERQALAEVKEIIHVFELHRRTNIDFSELFR